jgi:hypothetical protein
MHRGKRQDDQNQGKRKEKDVVLAVSHNLHLFLALAYMLHHR